MIDRPVATRRGSGTAPVIAVRYEERPGIPVWAAAVVVVVWGGSLGMIWLVVHGDTIGLVFFVCLFFFTTAYSLWTHARRRVWIDDEFFRLGRREPVPLEAIQGFGVLTGRPLRKLRSELFWPAPSSRMAIGMGLAAMAGAWGTVSLAGGLSGARSRYGLACPFWFRFGVVVHAPYEPAKRTMWTPIRMPYVWLIGTRRPDELIDALKHACEARREALGHSETSGEQGL